MEIFLLEYMEGVLSPILLASARQNKHMRSDANFNGLSFQYGNFLFSFTVTNSWGMEVIRAKQGSYGSGLAFFILSSPVTVT